MIEAGTPAPDFTLPDQDGNEVSLSDLRGRTVVLVFFPMAFSPVCTDQFNVYQEVLGDLREQGVQLYGISVDSSFTHKAFREKLGVEIPMLADYHPRGEVARRFGVFIEERGHTGRQLVMIDPDGVVRWTHEGHPLDIPGANLIFDAVARVGAARQRAA